MEFLFIWVLLAAGVGWLASSRGRSGFGFFLLSALLSPLLGLIIVLVVQNKNEEAEKERLRREDHERQLESIRAVASKANEATTPGRSVTDELAKLAELRDKGVLTDAEFQIEKLKILGQRR
jgi:hypothetical protein